MNLLPQVRPKDLDVANLERGDLAVHKDSSQVQLNLESYVHVGAINCWRPPQREAAVGDLVQAAPLGVCQLLVPAQMKD